MKHPSTFWPRGTVYGTLLNFDAELRALGEQVTQAPYKAAPQAPVLYVKTANTWSASGADIAVPARVSEVEVGASIAMVMGAPRFDALGGPAKPCVAGYVLVNDVSLPHTSFFRPPVKAKCLDGFLGVGPVCITPNEAGDPSGFVLEVRVNGALRQTVRFSEALRDAATLLADVSSFMRMRPGDLLLLGCGPDRPLAGAGDHITISAPGHAAFGTLANQLVAQEAA